MDRPILAFVAALSLLGTLAAASPKEADVIVVGDALRDVPVALRPEPGKPIYYIILGNSEVDLGFPMGGMPRPDPKAMEAELVKVLAEQGFVQTMTGGPMADIVLVFSWGTANMATEDTPGTNPDTGVNEDDPDAPAVMAYNRKEMRRLVGADKADWQNVTLVDGDKIGEAVRSDRVYIFLIAFDARTLVKKQKTVLWRTRMSVDLLDHALPDSFALMLASAAPYFGRNTDQPVFVDDRTRNAHVKLGETKFLGDVPDPAAESRPADREKNH